MKMMVCYDGSDEAGSAEEAEENGLVLSWGRCGCGI